MAITEKKVMDTLAFAAKMTGIDLTDTDKQFYLAKLKGRLSGEEVVNALDDMIEKGKKPTLSAILAYEKGGYDDADTAYSKAIASLIDESKTCLMNDAMMKAWSIAQPLYSEGMNYDASRAFKRAYDEAVREQKEIGNQRPKWFLSMGTDKTQREEFIRQAVFNGQIALDYAKTQLQHLTLEEIKNPNAIPQQASILRLEDNLKQQNYMSEADIESGKKCLNDLKKLLMN